MPLSVSVCCNTHRVSTSQGDQPPSASPLKNIPLSYDSRENAFSLHQCSPAKQKDLNKELRQLLNELTSVVASKNQQVYNFEQRTSFYNSILQALIFIGILSILAGASISLTFSNRQIQPSANVDPMAVSYLLLGMSSIPFAMSFCLWNKRIPECKQHQSQLQKAANTSIKQLIMEKNNSFLQSKGWKIVGDTLNDLSIKQICVQPQKPKLNSRSNTMPELRTLATLRHQCGITKDPLEIRKRLLNFETFECKSRKSF